MKRTREVMFRMLLHPKETSDEFEKYNVPYLISSCISLLPCEATKDILKDKSVLVDLFGILSNSNYSLE